MQNQIIRPSANTHILAKIADFPFDVLYVPHQTTFWNHTTSALYDHCILTIWRIAVDEHSDFLTLNRFRDHIFANLRSDGDFPEEQVKKLLADQLRTCRFGERLTDKQIERFNHYRTLLELPPVST